MWRVLIQSISYDHICQDLQANECDRHHEYEFAEIAIVLAKIAIVLAKIAIVLAKITIVLAEIAIALKTHLQSVKLLRLNP
jgi:hypothetical protein